MLYEIKLTIASEYDRSANGGRHLLRLMPMDGASAGQRLIAGSFDTRPPAREPLLWFSLVCSDERRRRRLSAPVITGARSVR